MSTARQELIIRKGFIRSLLDGTLEIKDLAGINTDLDRARQAQLQELLDKIEEGLGFDLTVSPSNNILHRNDKLATSNSVEPEKVKEIAIGNTGFYRIHFSLEMATSPEYSAYARIYKNDVAYGTPRETSTFLETNENLSFVAGDLVQIYAHTGTAMAEAHIRDFQLRGDTIKSIGANTLE